tara:strand:+ start:244 stop:513 length:270 start_codon:yes stop_codon:yes gene_type:complete
MSENFILLSLNTSIVSIDLRPRRPKKGKNHNINRSESLPPIMEKITDAEIKIKIKSKFWFDSFNRPINKSLEFLKTMTNKKQRKKGPKA